MENKLPTSPPRNEMPNSFPVNTTPGFLLELNMKTKTAHLPDCGYDFVMRLICASIRAT
jgi:hypothetical protein